LKGTGRISSRLWEYSIAQRRRLQAHKNISRSAESAAQPLGNKGRHAKTRAKAQS
jgi:hypothetical protein